MQADACTLFLVDAVDCGIVGDPTTVCRRTDAETWDLVTIPPTYHLTLWLDRIKHERISYTSHVPVQLILRLIAAKVGIDELAVHGFGPLLVEAPVAHEDSWDVRQRVLRELVLGVVLPTCPEGRTTDTDAADGA